MLCAHLILSSRSQRRRTLIPICSYATSNCHYKTHLKKRLRSTSLQLPCNTSTQPSVAHLTLELQPGPRALDFKALSGLYVCFKVEEVVPRLLYIINTDTHQSVSDCSAESRISQICQSVSSETTSSGGPPIPESRSVIPFPPLRSDRWCSHVYQTALRKTICMPLL